MNRLLSRHSDLFLALFVLSVAAMLLVPLPTPLLDFLLVINLGVSLLLLLVGLYMPNALAMSAFPALLLLTTLFRLSLNVASTRLILSQGDAGEVIQAFGRLLVQGEVVVGLIIFLIITIVNFVVIARGSARVSEVAARFTLDALPGKQMAIDADLRAGLLTPEEAQRKREDLRTESQLYGAMDGSMKFVQGDAVAGLFIIATNLVGGLYVGLTKGLGFREAVDTYLILTVGDGLVSQIPALLISICAGIVVTRVATGDARTLSAEVGAQLFTNPAALTVSGGLLIFMGLFSGLPWLPFLAVGAVLMVSAVAVRRRRRLALLEAGGSSAGVDILALPRGSTGLLPSGDEVGDRAELVVSLDAAVLLRTYRENVDRWHTRWSQLQREFFDLYGLRYPRLRIVAGESLQPSSFEIYLSGVQALRGSVPLDAVMVEMHADQARLCGMEIVGTYVHPRTQSEAIWVRRTGALEQLLEAGQIRSYEPVDVIGLELAEFLVSNPQYALSVTDIYRQLKQTEKKHPGLVSEAFAKAAASVPRLAEVLYGIIRAGLGVRDFRQTLESIASYCAMEGHALSDDDGVEIPEVVQFVRRQRRREILQRYVGPRSSLAVITVDESASEALDETEVQSDLEGGGLVVDVDNLERLRRGLERELGPVRSRGTVPVVLLVPSELRSKAEGFLKLIGARLTVLSSEELDPRIALEPAGVWATEPLA